MILELFGGPGGWDEGLLPWGERAVGLELDADACATRAAAGHLTIRADVAAYQPPPARLVDGLIASPPCPTFSMAGAGEGVVMLPELLRAVRACATGWHPEADAWTFGDPRTGLILQPLRYVHACAPDWIALEQVPPALPVWRAYAEVLEGLGYRTWCGVLNAADYGVPQTRRRAFLMAHRYRQPHPPAATHGKDPQPDLFGAGLRPWVSMAEALGWEDEARVGFPRADDRGDSPDGYRERDTRPASEPSFALTEKARSWKRHRSQGPVFAMTGYANGTVRRPDEPAPTLAFGHLNGRWLNTGRDWKPGGDRSDAQQVPDTEPAPALTAKSGGQWIFDRPATTIAGDPRCWPPGHKINRGDERRLGAEEAARRYGDRAGTDAVRITIEEALVLQSFPADYPVAGSKTAKFRQIGDAVPPLLGAAIIGELLR